MRVFAIAAITANGFIGQTSDQMSWDWTSPEDRALLVRLTKEAGAVVLGTKTFNTFKRKRAFPERRTIIYTHHPEDLVQIPDIETTAESPEALVGRLKKEGAAGLAVIGGTSIYTQFLESGMLDELYFTVEPILFGTGIALFRNTTKKKLQLLDASQLNSDTILLHYAVAQK